MMTTGPVQRVEKHVLDGAGLWLKTGITVKASARRQVCRAGGCRLPEPSSGRNMRLPSVYAAIRGEGTIPAKKVVIAPLHLTLNFCWLL